MILGYLLAALCGYLIGAVPSGYLAVKLWRWRGGVPAIPRRPSGTHVNYRLRAGL